jgi:RimJ/RimL family protein N-acetyltransferase
MITLRPFARADFARLIGWIPSAEFLLQWAGPAFTFPLDTVQLDAYLAESEGEAPSRMIFTAVESDTATAVGHIELARIDRRNKSATLSRVLIGEASRRGQGAGLEMVRRILQIGFERLTLHRIDLVVFDFNASAIACYERAGFVKEGCLREARRFGEEYWSLVQMSILDTEWSARVDPPRGDGANDAGRAPSPTRGTHA